MQKSSLYQTKKGETIVAYSNLILMKDPLIIEAIYRAIAYQVHKEKLETIVKTKSGHKSYKTNVAALVEIIPIESGRPSRMLSGRSRQLS